MKITLGISGASGAVLAQKAIEYLSKDHELSVVASDNGSRIFEEECKISLYDFLRRKHNVSRFYNNDLAVSIASGTSDQDAMIILPCSAATVGRIACGSGDTLLTRAADVTLKERKRLVLAIRESPLGTITLKNLEYLSLCGAVVCPITPPFYCEPKTLDELYDLTLGRILLSAGIKTDLIEPYKG